MTTEERIKAMDEHFWKQLEEQASKDEDLKLLLEYYKTLTTQKTWSEEFLKGYLSCISDLAIIKRTR